MKDYKDITISKLCSMINYLDDLGCISEEEWADYRGVVLEYEERREQEILAARDHEVYTSYSNCVVLRSKEDGEVTTKVYDSEMADVMMHDVSKVICFSDCDDMWDIVKIVYCGREVEYDGWRPGMVMSYSFKDTGDEAWVGRFPSWDH